jgi:Ca-activated chloride channel family protein
MRSTVIVSFAVALLGLTLEGRGTQPAAPAPAAPQPAGKLVVAKDSSMLLELETSLHTRTTKTGDRVSFVTTEDVRVGNRVAIPRGSFVRATVTQAQRAGRLAGRAEIRLRFDELRLVDGTTVPFGADVMRAGLSGVKNKKGEPTLKGEGGSNGNVMVIAKGGLEGAVLGGIFGGARGAATAGAVGAGVGLAGILLKRGPDLDLPRSMIFEVKTDRTIEVPAAAAQRAEQIARTSAPPMPTYSGLPPLRGDIPPQDRNPEPVPDFSKDTAPAATGPDVPAPRLPREAPANPAPGTKPAAAEAPLPSDAGAFKLSVDVQLVVVDAVVRDRTGRPMDNLKREDFRLFEDGAEQPIRNFSKDEFPLAVALVIDRSGSVAPYINEIRHAAYRALMQLKRGDKVALFTFAGEVQRLEDLTTDRQRIADRIATIRGGGGTNIGDALFDAVYYLGMVAPDSRRAVVLISDNEATTKPRVSEAQTIRMAMESETVVYSVKTPGEGTPLTLRLPNLIGGQGPVPRITRETGGEIIDVNAVGSLDAALGEVISRLRLRYTLGYYPAQQTRDGAFRKIDVRLAERFGRQDADYSVHSRRGYYSTADKMANRRP